MPGFFTEIKNYSRILSRKWDGVFYSEAAGYYQYYEQIHKDISQFPRKFFCYITSDKNDPILKEETKNFKVFYIKLLLGPLLNQLKSRVVFMTMPDLGNFLFKRSPFVDNYVYVFHALVSLHQQYRHRAFFNYDTFLCTGPHHAEELEEMISIYNLPPKKILKYGYPLIEKIEQICSHKALLNETTVLIAPSWFEGCIFDTCITELVTTLVNNGYQLVIRPHPEYVKRNSKDYRALVELTNTKDNVKFDVNKDVYNSLVRASILITDRSGIAFEYFLATGQPVIFIETAKKKLNNHENDFKTEPVENSMRNDIGFCVHMNQINTLPALVSEILAGNTKIDFSREKLKSRLLYDSLSGKKVINQLIN